MSQCLENGIMGNYIWPCIGGRQVSDCARVSVYTEVGQLHAFRF
jgi:hypothetical protein